MSPRQVRIYRYRHRRSIHGNFGDEMTTDILDRLFGLQAVPVAMHQAELIGAGSVLDIYAGRSAILRLKDLLTSGRAATDLHVWGTGLMLGSMQPSWPQRIHYHAVRGPLTAQRIAWADAVDGDPGILASRLIERRPDRRHAVALVPHFTDFTKVASGNLPGHWVAVNPEDPATDVIRQIASAELVVSSSLHGLITADSFGIPCVWLATETRPFGNTTFKFRDYEGSRGRPFNDPFPYREAFGLSLDRLHAIATTAARNISQWQDELINAFPFRR